MASALVRLIIYVHDVGLLKRFYQKHFELPVIEDLDGEWVVFKAGGMELALHRVGRRYRREGAPAIAAAADGGTADGTTTKFVFAVTSDLSAHRDALRLEGVHVSELKRYDGFAYWMYDGRDPEGNVFQVMRYDEERSA